MSVLFCGGLAYALGGASVAHAVMGESAENRGLVLADEKDEVLIACVLGSVCQTDESFFRRLPATQIIRDAAVIESGITIPLDLSEDGGIGFGSLLSTEDDVDTLCWTGNDRRECVEIGGTTSDGGGDIIEIQADQPDPDSECADAEELFGQPPDTFDYLARFFTDRFGLDDAVVVVTCDGVTATSLTLTGPLPIHTGVVVTATRSMSAYDRIRFGGGYCC